MSDFAKVLGIGWRLLAATLASAVLAVAGLVIGAGPAWAHNVLKSTSPADGEAVARTPSIVVLTFDEPGDRLPAHCSGAALGPPVAMFTHSAHELDPRGIFHQVAS